MDYESLAIGFVAGFVAGRVFALYPVERTLVTIERAITNQPTARGL